MQLRELLVGSPMFDPAFYLQQNPDVAAGQDDAVQHYLEFGWREGRRPCLSFDGDWYLRQNPDVARAKINPLVHYLAHGRREGRRAHKPVVVYTAVIGDYDELRAPSMVDPNVDYVVFIDHPSVQPPAPWVPCRYQQRHGNDRLTARFIKTHPHVLLPEYELSVWVDAAFQIHAISAEAVARSLGDVSIAFFRHPDRDCAYDEAEAVLEQWLDPPDAVTAMVARLKADGHPPHAGLVATGVIISRHNVPDIVNAMERWWTLISTYSSRDQLSINFVLDQASVEPAVLPGSLWRNDMVEWIAHRQKRWRGLECGGAYLDAEEYDAIAQIVSELKIRTAVETGAGETTILFKMLGVLARSIEYNPGPWSERAASYGCRVIEVPFDPTEQRFSPTELQSALAGMNGADLLFIDSPVGTDARRQVLSQMLEHVRLRYVLYHDARRDLDNIFADQANHSLTSVRFVDSPRGLALFARQT